MMENNMNPIPQTAEGKAKSVRIFYAADVTDALVDELKADIASEKEIGRAHV